MLKAFCDGVHLAVCSFPTLCPAGPGGSSNPNSQTLQFWNELSRSLTQSTQVVALPHVWVRLDVWHATQLYPAYSWLAPPCCLLQSGSWWVFRGRACREWALHMMTLLAGTRTCSSEMPSPEASYAWDFSKLNPLKIGPWKLKKSYPKNYVNTPLFVHKDFTQTTRVVCHAPVLIHRVPFVTIVCVQGAFKIHFPFRLVSLFYNRQYFISSYFLNHKLFRQSIHQKRCQKRKCL